MTIMTKITNPIFAGMLILFLLCLKLVFFSGPGGPYEPLVICFLLINLYGGSAHGSLESKVVVVTEIILDGDPGV